MMAVSEKNRQSKSFRERLSFRQSRNLAVTLCFGSHFAVRHRDFSQRVNVCVRSNWIHLKKKLAQKRTVTLIKNAEFVTL